MQALQDSNVPYLHFAADNVPTRQTEWISDCWDTARAKMRAEGGQDYLLVIDEIQKIDQWSEVVKSNNENDNVGLHEFCKRFNPRTSIVVGKAGIPAEEFLSVSPVVFFK